VALLLIVIALYLTARRSLAATGGKRGRAWPWIAVSALMTAPFLFFQPFLIPTGAMEDTLAVGDRILVRRYPKPVVTRGDLVVFTSPVDRRQTYVKRVIGMPGDRIRISNKVVIRNGEPLSEPYAVHKTEYIDLYRDNFPAQPEPPVAEHAREMLVKHVDNGEVVVPAGKYFVLGDNRDNSLDSRYWGFVDAADVLGEPVVIYSSISGGAHGNYPFKLL
jgi:signal peptidase I